MHFCTFTAFPPSTCYKKSTASLSLSARGALEDSNHCLDFDSVEEVPNIRRRSMVFTWGLAGSAILVGGATRESSAAALIGRSKKASDPSSLYVVPPVRNMTDALIKNPVDAEPYSLSSELCLLKILPVKNPVFRSLQSRIEMLSKLQTKSESLIKPEDWKEAEKVIDDAITELDNKRGLLEPVFNPEDSTMMGINKSERSEQLIENLRNRFVDLLLSISKRQAAETVINQRSALLALSDVGELLVTSFPYTIPSSGKFSYLPRLMGRARVTFTFRRGAKSLGNVTIIADGYTAPITAGNFVDLCVRNFYTGLPIKSSQGQKRLVWASAFELANIPILGSFQEGFYDPLTAQPRRIPLETIRLDKKTGVPELSYAPDLNFYEQSFATDLQPSDDNIMPLLSFQIPGLIAMNHPDRNPNGASSEFFGVQKSKLEESNVADLLDGKYAPFGYIVDGFDLFQTLKPSDVIDATFVDDWGKLNLSKLRESSFSEVVKGPDEEEESK